MLTDGLISVWKVNGHWLGERDNFDHFPIWLFRATKDWGPKPFMYVWLEHKEFKPMVAQFRNECQVTGKKGYEQKEKRKMLKARLRT